MKKLKLLQLAKLNAAKSQAFKAEVNERDANIYLHGVIGGWWGDIDETEFAKTLADLDVDNVHLRINSPGGDVFAARAMMTAIRNSPAKVIAHIDGIAASAATGVCMACDEIEISQGAQFMIHNAWTISIGNKSDLTKEAELLTKIDADLANDYARKTGKSVEEIAAFMDAESWFNADEAVNEGFADRKVEVVSGKASNWDLSAYKNAPQPAAQDPDIDDQISTHRNDLERRFSLLEKIPA